MVACSGSSRVKLESPDEDASRQGQAAWSGSFRDHRRARRRVSPRQAHPAKDRCTRVGSKAEIERACLRFLSGRRRSVRDGRRSSMPLFPRRAAQVPPPVHAFSLVFAVKGQCSGLMSTSGVPSQQSRPRTTSHRPSISARRTIAVPIGFGRTGDRIANVPKARPLWEGFCVSRSRRARSSQ